ncbi:dihydroorotate dehydrogenase electron transfer subunit [Clostridium sp. D2Q-11]|uniref:Dihydroorotate dehydrogenase electron transfer subunit n=1 Tax=Anaeromonas frigoriresistens TaxID=2683708 RepID=A0A942UW65_9FIRM|nr:dihydroorotate dehydrogenase electron transfer subunit [Anaeromonas frigoriresistens]MBS4539190.1 dihydroorotate dehydrogenase electron transfer subunit [Anaeromonas frigoriresistens]
MAKIICNEKLSEDMFLITIEGDFPGEMGQFYMIRGWEDYPLLSRPLSIHEINDGSISFIYKVLGEGTLRLSKLQKDDNITLHGPYGNGFPKAEGRVALVGGGMGIAPLLYTAKKLHKTVDILDIYMGFRDEALLVDKYKQYADESYISIGSNITDQLDISKYDYILTCGPEPMIKRIVEMKEDNHTKIYVSMEKHMACGIGACLVCSCESKNGMTRVCKDGPVYLGEEIFYE